MGNCFVLHLRFSLKVILSVSFSLAKNNFVFKQEHIVSNDRKLI